LLQHRKEGAALLKRTAIVVGLSLVGALAPPPPAPAQSTVDPEATTAVLVTEAVDDADYVGAYSSLALDKAGNPVISYFDATNSTLKLAHCNDPACTDGGESIVTVDTTEGVGEYTSLSLDASGNPVIAYHDFYGGNLKVAHCDDPNCSGGGESIETLDMEGVTGLHASLQLDASGNPVVAYYNTTADDLKVAHCNDPNCTGGDESIETVDDHDNVGRYASLALDESGHPVVAFREEPDDNLVLIHCNDPDCAGGDESREIVDHDGEVGGHASLDLDASGNPVIAYYDQSNANLKLAHCNDPNCAGGDESIETVDDDGGVGVNTSLRVDPDGNPVMSYQQWTDLDLKLMRCNDPNCAGDDESIITVDAEGTIGQYGTSLAIDAAGGVAISYLDWTNGDLKLAREGGLAVIPDTDPLVVFVQGIRSEWSCESPGDNVLDLFDWILTWKPDADFAIWSYRGVYEGCGVDAPRSGEPWPTQWPDYEKSDTCFSIDAGGYSSAFRTWFETISEGRDEVHVLSHSMGGVVVTNALAEWGEDVPSALRSIITLDSPLQGRPAADLIGVIPGDCVITDPALDDLNPGSDTIAAVNSLDEDLLLLVTAVGNNQDIVVPPTISHLPGAWLNFRIDVGCLFDLLDHECVLTDDRTRNEAIWESITRQRNGTSRPDPRLERCFGEWANWVGSPAADVLGQSLVNAETRDVVVGGDGDDAILTGGGNDMVCAGGGDDAVHGGDGNDAIDGGPDDDVLQGDDGDDTMFGRAGEDVLRGNAGIDTLRGDGGDDTVLGGDGDDVLFGGGGNDTVKGQGGSDTVRGQSGHDRLLGGGGSDRVLGGGGDDTVKGQGGDDLLEGQSGDDVHRGGGGNDIIRGGPDHDRMFGQRGDDVLIGDGGSDLANGGIGLDRCDSEQRFFCEL
jgi:hypothetical protein